MKLHKKLHLHRETLLPLHDAPLLGTIAGGIKPSKLSCDFSCQCPSQMATCASCASCDPCGVTRGGCETQATCASDYTCDTCGCGTAGTGLACGTATTCLYPE